MDVQDYKINYKSDFVLTINGDAGWAIPFCIKFWTGAPSQAYFVGFDGVKYVNCRIGDDPTKLVVLFDDHHLPIGELKMQIAYHTTIEEFPGSVYDEVTNARDVIVDIDGTEYHVMLDFDGETAPELEFNLPAYAAEQQRIENELQRQQQELQREQNETQRIENEEGRISAEQTRQQTFDKLAGDVEGLKVDAQQAVDTANEASRTANAAAENADAKAQEAELASQRADNAAAQAVAIANTAATRAEGIANDAATRAVGIANEAATNAETIAKAAAKSATDAANNADAKAQKAEEAAEGANNVNATADGTVITVTNRQGESSSIDVNDVMLALIGINEILDEINGEVI